MQTIDVPNGQVFWYAPKKTKNLKTRTVCFIARPAVGLLCLGVPADERQDIPLIVVHQYMSVIKMKTIEHGLLNSFMQTVQASSPLEPLGV
jgi:hypothetical protein